MSVTELGGKAIEGLRAQPAFLALVLFNVLVFVLMYMSVKDERTHTHDINMRLTEACTAQIGDIKDIVEMGRRNLVDLLPQIRAAVSMAEDKARQDERAMREEIEEDLRARPTRGKGDRLR